MRTRLGSQSAKGAFGHAKNRPALVYPAHVDRFNLNLSALYHIPVGFVYYVEGVVSLPELALLPQRGKPGSFTNTTALVNKNRCF